MPLCPFKGLNALGELMPLSFPVGSCIFPGCSVNVAALRVTRQGVFEAEKGPSQAPLSFLKVPLEQHLWNAATRHLDQHDLSEAGP